MSNPSDNVWLANRGSAPTKAKETEAEVNLGHLTANVLLHLARNEAATKEWRKAAIKMLLNKGFENEANHPELLALLLEVKADLEAEEEVEGIVQSAIQNG